MYNNITFFPNLNACRFFAALLVLFHHGEVIRAKNDFIAYTNWSFFQNGGSAVRFFFVLSGFLITYLLLKERTTRTKVSITNFYLRRVLRIWPLYFLLVAIGTLFMPFLFNLLNIDYTFPYSFSQSWVYFLLFVPSLVTFQHGSHLLEPLWSIGVEEWFYLLWAPLFNWFKKPLTFIGFTLLAKTLLLILVQTNTITHPIAIHLIKTYAFEAMAIGGLGAYILFHTKHDIRSYYQRYAFLQWIFILVLVIFVFFRSTFSELIHYDIFDNWFFNYIVLSLLFLNVIIYCGVMMSSNSWLNSKLLDIGGQISYGIYMYHMLVIFTVIHFGKNILSTYSPAISFILFYTLIIGGTITISYLSKRYFEDYFLKFKNKLS